MPETKLKSQFKLSVLTSVFLVCLFQFPIAVKSQDAKELGGIVPPKIAGGKLTIKLPKVVDEIKVGGDGRFILLHFKELRKIGLLDLNVANIVHYFPANEDDTVFDAGKRKLVIASGVKKTIARYDLLTHELELKTKLDIAKSTTHLLMGAATEGPIFVGEQGDRRGYEGKGIVIDLKTLKPIEIEMESSRRGFGAGGAVRISANGDTISQWSTSGSPSGLQSLVKTGSKWKGYYDHTSVGRILPSPNGKLLYTSRGIYTNRLRAQGKPVQYSFQVPAVHGDFYLSVDTGGYQHSSKKPFQEVVNLHRAGDPIPLGKIQGLSKIANEGDKWGRQVLTMEKRLILVPDANLICQLADTADSITLFEFNLKQALDESGVDYLVVRSRPKLEIKLGERFGYQMDVLSNNEGVKFELDAAPAGMQVSAEGKVDWLVPNDVEIEEEQVIISVSDLAGQKVYHMFSIKILGVADALKAKQEESANAEIVQQRKQLEEARKLAFIKEQKQAKAMSATKTPSGQSEGLESKLASTFPLRSWTHRSGKNSFMARFHSIENKKTVVLISENGETLKTAISQFSDSDIYEAVKSDLIRLGSQVDSKTKSPLQLVK
jgi:hypothetical protein